MDHLAAVHDVDDPPLDPLAQDQRMRAVLVQLEILTYGGTYQYEGATARQKPLGGECPAKRWGAAPDEAEPLHLHWRARYVLAAAVDREDVIAQATDALIAARVRTEPIPVGESAEDWEKRAIEDCEGMTAREAAVHMRTGTLNIVRVRRKLVRDPNNGTRLPESPSIQELAARGLSPKQIGWVLGWSRQRVEYHVNKQRRMAA